MELTVHTYGHIDAMFYCLNAIAMLMSSGFGESLMLVVTMSTVGYYALKMSYSGANGFKAHLGKVIAMVAMIYFMLLPKADMMIYDHVSKKQEKVDNLPIGFALPVGILETFGDLLTLGFEQAFTMVSNTNYRDYGMVFGARLIQESRNWRIRSPEFMENMSNFIDRCVMLDAMIGYHYTPEELLKTDDIWSLVKANAATLRYTSVRIGKTKRLMSCDRAAKEVLDPAFKLEIEALEKKVKDTDIAQAGQTNYVQRTFQRLTSNFKKNIELSFKNYAGVNIGGEKLIRQQMMINAIRNYSSDYGYVRASATQESNWRIAGDLASTYLPILMSVLKGLVYSSFIFMVPMLIMSGGWSRYLGYLTLVASFQLWAPLNAVLNMFIDIYSSTTLLGIADRVVSFSTISQIGNYTDKIVAVASGLQMAIPFLAFSLMQGGVGGFIHLAGTITGASQSAASQAANESVTGNKSFDNYSVGNQQLYQQGGFKTDWNESYAAGASSFQHMDGTMEKVTAGGNTLRQSGIGFTASSGATSYKHDDSRVAQVSTGAGVAVSMHQQGLRSLSNSNTSTIGRNADYVSHLAQREHAGESFNYDSMGEEGTALRQAVSSARQLHDNSNYGWQQAANTTVEASATLGTPMQFITGSGASIGVKGTVGATNSSEQSVEENNSVNQEKHTDKNYANLVRAASNSSWARENNIDTSYSDAVRSAYEEQQRLEQQCSISQQEVDDWHKAQTIVNSNSGNSSRDMYQEVVNQLKQDYGVDASTAHKMADRRSPEAQKAWQKLQQEDHYVQDVMHNIRQGRAAVSGASGREQLDRFTNQHQDKISNNPDTAIREYAEQQGMNVGGFKKQLQEQGDSLKKKHENIRDKNLEKYAQVRSETESKEQKATQQVEKYEEDRIGKGFIGTLGHSVNGVGKPDDKK